MHSWTLICSSLEGSGKALQPEGGLAWLSLSRRQPQRTQHDPGLSIQHREGKYRPSAHTATQSRRPWNHGTLSAALPHICPTSVSFFVGWLLCFLFLLNLLLTVCRLPFLLLLLVSGGHGTQGFICGARDPCRARSSPLTFLARGLWSQLG